MAPPIAAPEWRLARLPVPYLDAMASMEARVQAIRARSARELVWLLEHPPLYTAGTSAAPGDLLMPDRFPVHRTGRGGRYTYHGPGQRVVYPVLDLNLRGRDLRRYVWQLEEWVIRTLASFGVEGLRRAGRVGIWVVKPGGREAKIAAIGVRVRHWVAFHGLAINVAPDLDHFRGIVPCGINEFGVTSLADVGVEVGLAEVDAALRASFGAVFDQPEPVLRAAAA